LDDMWTKIWHRQSTRENVVFGNITQTLRDALTMTSWYSL